MSWNYRIVLHKVKRPGAKEVENFFQIHEVYYSKKGVPEMVTVEGIAAHGDSRDELLGDLARMFLDAIRHPVIGMAYFDRLAKKRGKKVLTGPKRKDSSGALSIEKVWKHIKFKRPKKHQDD